MDFGSFKVSAKVMGSVYEWDVTFPKGIQVAGNSSRTECPMFYTDKGIRVPSGMLLND